jgi:hypothetical protein
MRMPRAARVCAAVVCAFGLSALSASAAGGTASAYRAQLNGICRGYTPLMKKTEADAVAAKKAGNVHRVYYDLGFAVSLALREDAAIEAVQVPGTMQPQMAPILKIFRVIDGHARTFFADARKNDLKSAMAELTTIDKLSAPLNGMLDRAGLPDCGSRQT